MYTFAQICSHLAIRMRPDGDSKIKIPNPDPSLWVGTLFGNEVARIIKLFSIEARSLYSPKTPITVASGIRDLNLSDTLVCAINIYDPIRLWLNGCDIYRRDGIANLTNLDIGTGTPSDWALAQDSIVRFNGVTSDIVANSYAEGFYEHPDITIDSFPIQGISTRELDLFSVFAECIFREGVASDGVGIDRLARYDDKAYRALLSLRARNNHRVYGDINR